MEMTILHSRSADSVRGPFRYASTSSEGMESAQDVSLSAGPNGARSETGSPRAHARPSKLIPRNTELEKHAPALVLPVGKVAAFFAPRMASEVVFGSRCLSERGDDKMREGQVSPARVKAECGGRAGWRRGRTQSRCRRQLAPRRLNQ